jgi:hypothetical protein
VTAFRETGLAAVLEEHMQQNWVIGDWGYLGEPHMVLQNKSISSGFKSMDRCSYLDCGRGQAGRVRYARVTKAGPAFVPPRAAGEHLAVAGP